MICKSCGEINADNSKFCSACGEPLVYDVPRTRNREEPFIYDAQRTQNREEALRYFSEEPQFDRSHAKSPDEYFFTPKSYGEEEPYSGGSTYAYQNERVSSRPKQKSNAAFIATSLITAVLAAFNFVLPFAHWITYQYSALGTNLAQGDMNLIGLVRRFLEKDNIVTFFIDSDSDFGITELLPNSVNDKFMYGRLGAMVIGGLFALGLLLFFIFILLVLFRSRAAVGMGISASLVTILADAGFLFAMNKFCALLEKYDVMELNVLTVTLKPTPYLSIGLCALIIVMSIVFSALDRRRR